LELIQVVMSLIETRVPAMTLGRFVRVTFHNFRLLIHSFSATTASEPRVQPMPDEQRPIIDWVDDDAGVRIPPSRDTGNARSEEERVLGLVPELDLSVQDQHAASMATPETGQVPARADAAALSLLGALESLLFVSDGPVEATQIARALELDADFVEALLRQLDDTYRSQQRGFRLMERNGRFQLVTAPAAAAILETFLNLDMTARLSAPALETLAVVAYRQPVTRAQVEAVRGVDCTGILRSLLQRGLIEEVDRLDAPGRPMLYGVTDLFMQHFGLTSLQDLPPLAVRETEQLDKAIDTE